MSTRRLFGTDGIRGVANRDLTPELALALGRALAGRLEPGSEVLLARDTRRSGPMLESALAAGLASGGVASGRLGVLPTPALAERVAATSAVAGAVISASHNPFPDNGIKIFGSDGFKLDDEQEAAIELSMDDLPVDDRPEGGGVGSENERSGERDAYIDSLCERYPLDLSGVDLVVDCANGAAVTTAPEVLSRLGAKATLIGVDPDGVNINEGCGSTHLELLAETVVSGGHDLGLAFDGDADRVLAVDGSGAPVDGDQILALCALSLRARGELVDDTVVTTTMTNLGFRRAMDAEGITVRWTDVGDRYVLADMRAGGYVLGGEQSGHLINLRHGPSGDGLASALQLLRALAERDEDLATAGRVMSRMPQKLVNVPVSDKTALPGAESVWNSVDRCETELGDDGRVVVRPSGTESLVRVMVEAPTEAECAKWCDLIADAVKADLSN